MTPGFTGGADLFAAAPLVSGETDRGRAVQIVIRGRGRVGKTVFANALGQFFRAAGARLQIWCIDAQDRPDSLGHFFPDAKFPPNLQPIDCRRWLEGMIHDQKTEGYDVILDVGTGHDAVIKKLRRDSDFPRTLEADGIRTISAFVVGTDAGDLDAVRRHLEDETSLGEAVLIVLNEGIVGHGPLRRVFEAVRNDPVIRLAETRGAVVVEMPELGCMRAVVKRKLTFQAAADDRRLTRVDDPLSFFDQERVAIWWYRKLPDCFKTIPAEWMPRIPERVAVS